MRCRSGGSEVGACQRPTFIAPASSRCRLETNRAASHMSGSTIEGPRPEPEPEPFGESLRKIGVEDSCYCSARQVACIIIAVGFTELRCWAIQ